MTLGQEKGARSRGWRPDSRASSLGHGSGLSAEDGAEEFGQEEAKGSLSGVGRMDGQRCDPRRLLPCPQAVGGAPRACLAQQQPLLGLADSQRWGVECPLGASPRQPWRLATSPPRQPGLNEWASVVPQWAFRQLVPLSAPRWPSLAETPSGHKGQRSCPKRPGRPRWGTWGKEHWSDGSQVSTPAGLAGPLCQPEGSVGVQ